MDMGVLSNVQYKGKKYTIEVKGYAKTQKTKKKGLILCFKFDAQFN
jgi:hypothetical protein